MRTIVGVIALLTVFSASGASLDRYKTFLNGTQSARAQFEQKVYDRNGKMTQETRGNFVFQRPGRFRWVYDKPADQVIVGDGSRVWIYDRQLNQVTVRKLTAALGSTPAALLAGGSGIETSFDLMDGGEKDGLEWMLAKPKDREAGFESVRMGFSADGLQAMELTDNFGQTTFLKFSKLVRNPQVNPNDVLGDK